MDPLFDHEKLDVYGVELGFVVRVNSGPSFSMTPWLGIRVRRLP